MRARRGFRGGAVAAAVLVLVGCAPPAAGGVLPAGVEVQLVQQRSDVAARTAQLRVINGSGDTLVVTDIALDDERFVDGPVREPRASTIPAGHTVDLRIALPEVVCGPNVADAGEGGVRLTLDGVGEVAAPFADPLDFVAPLHERECRAAAMAEVAGLALLDFRESGYPDPGVLELGVMPAGGAGEIEVVELRPTNLLQFAVDSGAPHPLALTVAGADPATVIEVPLVPLRCDPHAVQEDKRGTVFTVEVRVDGDDGLIQLAAEEELRARVLNWVAAWCGF